MSTPQHLLHLHEDLSADLDRIARRFKDPKITLVVRAPELKDGDVVLTNDNLESAIEAIRRLEAKAAHVIETTDVLR